LFICISSASISFTFSQNQTKAFLISKFASLSSFFFLLSSFVAMTRNLEKRSSAGNGSPSRNSGGSGKVVSRSTTGKKSPPTPENIDRKMSNSRSAAKDEKPNGSIVVVDRQIRQVDSTRDQSEKEVGVANSSVVVVASEGEKEDDFFAMKGTKQNVNHEMRDINLLILIKFNIFIIYMES
jgi:hypothetical protein